MKNPSFIETIVSYQRTLEKATMRKKLSIETTKRLRDMRDHGLGRYISFNEQDYWTGRIRRMEECSTFIQIKFDEAQQRSTLHRANFCYDRLCAMCQWRRSQMNFKRMLEVYQARPKENRWVLLTLTTRNSKREDLSERLSLMLEAWHRISRRKAFKKAFQGYARSFEITYNHNHDQFHPHIHVLLEATPAYFNSVYYDNEFIAAQWLSALGSEYTHDRAYVYIQAIAEGEATQHSAIKEVTKYMNKSISLPIMPLPTLFAFAQAVKGRRLISLGGTIAETAKALKIDFESNEEGEETDEALLQTDTAYIILRWSQYGSAYYQFSEFNPFERK